MITELVEAAPGTAPALRAAHISKNFGHVAALDDVDVEAHDGEILAIVGDNGAGKSTLVKIITGVYRPDHGSMSVYGDEVSMQTPAEARSAGIGSVQQDLALVEVLDVATNMFLGQIPRHGWFADRRRMDREARSALDELGVTIQSVRTPIGLLSGGQRQIIAIARALRTGANIVVLDEPTAALGVRETLRAKEIICGLRERNRAVIVVSHDLQLVFDIADRVQVMRLGRVAGTRPIAGTDREEVVAMITGAITDSPESAA